MEQCGEWVCVSVLCRNGHCGYVVSDEDQRSLNIVTSYPALAEQLATGIW
jgi:hypothetical protein